MCVYIFARIWPTFSKANLHRVVRIRRIILSYLIIGFQTDCDVGLFYAHACLYVAPQLNRPFIWYSARRNSRGSGVFTRTSFFLIIHVNLHIQDRLSWCSVGNEKLLRRRLFASNAAIHLRARALVEMYAEPSPDTPLRSPQLPHVAQTPCRASRRITSGG